MHGLSRFAKHAESSSGGWAAATYRIEFAAKSGARFSLNLDLRSRQTLDWRLT
jgi:hypothetical protein